MTILTKTLDKRDHPIVRQDGKIPYWNYYVKAYAFAEQAKLGPVIAIEFYSKESAALHCGVPVDQFVQA